MKFTDYDKKQLTDANLIPKTGLATDYLNVFNEAVMMLSLLPDMPEIINDLENWKPLSYEEHFKSSSLINKDFIIEVYNSLPKFDRLEFELLTQQLIFNTQSAIAEAQVKINNGENLYNFSSEITEQLHYLISLIDGRIHGQTRVTAQDEIDELFG